MRRHTSGALAVTGLLLIAGAAIGLALDASAQGRYPKQILRVATHSSPGGGSDVFLREMAPHLSRIMGVTVVVDNLPGGSGARAMATLARSKPDGALLYATTPTFIYTSLLSRPATTYRDLEPLVNVFFDPEVIYTAADSTFKTFGDVIDVARKRSARWGAANPASLERQTLEQLKRKAGVSPAVVTFDGGGDMLINVLNHTLDIGIGELQEIRGQLDARKLRVLAIAGDDRLKQLPGVPTLKEQGIDLSVRKFRGLAGPKGTPAPVIAALESAVPKLLSDPAFVRIYTANGLQPGYMPHAEYTAFISEFGRQTEAFLKETRVIK
jgi:tripartite-type tricarboxylate transporter receptor subunit TctC